MSRDGLLPSRFAKVSRRFGTPYVSVLLTGGFMVAMIALLRISDLIKVASTMMLILFLLVNVAVLVMRSSHLQNYRPLYRSPLFPWMQIVGVLVYAALVGILAAKLGPVPLLTTGGFIAAALGWYFVYVRPRSHPAWLTCDLAGPSAHFGSDPWSELPATLRRTDYVM